MIVMLIQAKFKNMTLKIFFVWDDELLSTQKIIAFLSKSLTKLHESAQTNATQ